MAYKTFEDMKYSIPEGATHYHNECDDYEFCWFKMDVDKWLVNCPKENVGWSRSTYEHSRDGFKLIPQTETQEEKDAFEAMGGVEWKNGDECRYENDITHEYTYIGKHPNTDGHYVFSEEKGITFVRDAYLSKPESPEQKAERERLEAAYDLYCLWGNAEVIDATLLSMHAFKELPLSKKWLAVVDKTGYRKAK